MAEKKIKWQYTATFEQFGKKLSYKGRATRSEILVQVEIVDSNPRLWTEFGYPKVFGIPASVDQCRLEIREKDLRP